MNDDLIEFLPRRYGGRLTGLFVVRSIAIWCAATIPLLVELTAITFHGKQPSSLQWLSIFGSLVLGMTIQVLAVLAWRQVEQRKVTWSSQTQVLSIRHHRVVTRFFSFGTIRQRVDLTSEDIILVKYIRGRGAHLRLQTRAGLITISSDLQPFDRLRNLIESQLVDSNG